MQLEKEYIYQVYLEGSFSKAAAKLFVTQPALSIAIRRVEQELGSPLFNRNSRPLKLTQVGALYIETVKKEYLLEQQLMRQIHDLQEVKAGEITIGGSHYMNAYVLPQYVAKFHELYPEVNVNFLETSSDRLISLLAEHQLDLTFSCDAEAIEQYEHYPAFKDTILLAVPERFPLPDEVRAKSLIASEVHECRHLDEAWPSVELQAFADLDFILLHAPVNLGYRSLKMFEEANIDPHIIIKVPQMVTTFHLAEQGLGAAFISDRLVSGNESNLHFFKINSVHTKRRYSVLLPNNEYTPAAVRAFIKLF